MNDNAKQWVAALRSEEYRQGTHVLHNNDDELCCLGVGCILFQKATGKLKVKEYAGEFSYDGKTTELPEIVRSWLGLQTTEGGYEDLESLTVHNDNGNSFHEIADIIESEPEGLFVDVEH